MHRPDYGKDVVGGDVFATISLIQSSLVDFRGP